jgi:translation initiation factor 5A
MPEGEKRFVSVGSIKPGSFLLIDGEACQVKSFEKSKPGKHGAAKARIVAFNIFTGSKKGLLKPTGSEAEVPIIARSSAQVVAVMGDIVQIMDLQSYETFDLKKPPEIEGLASGVEVEYIRWGDSVKIARKKGTSE